MCINVHPLWGFRLLMAKPPALEIEPAYLQGIPFLECQCHLDRCAYDTNHTSAHWLPEGRVINLSIKNMPLAGCGPAPSHASDIY